MNKMHITLAILLSLGLSTSALAAAPKVGADCGLTKLTIKEVTLTSKAALKLAASTKLPRSQEEHVKIAKTGHTGKSWAHGQAKQSTNGLATLDASFKREQCGPLLAVAE